MLPKKSLKIPKEQSETVYRRRTDNTMAKRKVQKDKQRSTKKTKDRVTRTPLTTGGELRCSGKVSSSCSTSSIRRVNLVTRGGSRVCSKGGWAGEGFGDRTRSPAGPGQSPGRGPMGAKPPPPRSSGGFEELQTFIWTTILNQPHHFYQTKKTTLSLNFVG